jgi:hypothetical protein
MKGTGILKPRFSTRYHSTSWTKQVLNKSIKMAVVTHDLLIDLQKMEALLQRRRMSLSLTDLNNEADFSAFEIKVTKNIHFQKSPVLSSL